MSASYAEVRDVETEVAQYSEDVWFFSTLTPEPTSGRDARRRSIERRRAPVPGEHTRRETSGVILSECGDLAVEHGRYVTSWATAGGADSVAGYYLLTYRKIGGEWKVAAASVHRRPSPAAVGGAAAGASVPAPPVRGYALQPHEGERLRFCDSPELSVVVKVSPASATGAQFVMGTADLAPRSMNFGRHADADEIVYFVQGVGHAVIGSDTAQVRAGTTLFVPRGVRHGFVNRGDSTMRFVWINSPPGLEERFREAAQPAGEPCPQPAPPR